jgi:hypothetical protein
MVSCERGPSPREHTLSNGDLVVSSHWTHGVRDAVILAAADKPLYRLLIEVLAESRVPDLMPARLATACDDLLDVTRAVKDIDRGLADIGGVGWGLSYCYRVSDAIEVHRNRTPKHLVVVGCSGTKISDPEPLAAAERYAGGYWTNKREYYETIGDEGRILSAEHGVLDPTEPIAYYETHIEDLDGIPVDHDGRLPSGDDVTTLVDLWAFNVYNGLTQWLQSAAGGVDPRDVDLEVLLGKPYHTRLDVRGVFDELQIRGSLDISFPFREEVDYSGGGGIGKQRSWMATKVEAARTIATDGGDSSPATASRRGDR